jgi:hypothetical protein
MRVMPRVHNPRIGKAPRDITSANLHPSYIFHPTSVYLPLSTYERLEHSRSEKAQ